MTNAILMASGLGTRLLPVTKTTPKPLVKVAGKPMIETLIDALEAAGVEHIYVVVGYLKEQFTYLVSKYPHVSLICNPDFKEVNNISSIYYAKKQLAKADCFICESDLFVRDKTIFQAPLDYSCYFGKMVQGYSADWVFNVDENGLINRVGKEGTNCYNMVGVAYFKQPQAEMIAQKIAQRYGHPGFKDLFWDDVVNENVRDLQLRVHPIDAYSIVEIDTVAELDALNKKLKGS